MNIKKIYLVRHGQTDFNLRGIVQGSGVDSSLNETGNAQAQDFFKRYADVPFDKIYTSALKRTHQSVAPFVNLGLPMESLAEVNEISWGVREGIPIDEEGNAFYMQMMAAWRRGETHVRIEGGESPDQVMVRMKRGLEHIISRTEESTVLICMHGRAMRIMLCLMLNYPLSAMDLFEHQNLCLYQLTHTGSMFTLDKFNDNNHITA